MPYKVFFSNEFENVFKKLNNDLRRQVQKEIKQLRNIPYSGKPLGFRFFREKKVKNHRIYFLIYEDFLAVLVVNMSTKKNQQEVIDKIKLSFHIYKELVLIKLKS